MGILFSIVDGGEELFTGEILTCLGVVWITGLSFKNIFEVAGLGLIYFIFYLISEVFLRNKCTVQGFCLLSRGLISEVIWTMS